MKRSYLLIPIGCLALGLGSLGCAGQVESSSAQEGQATQNQTAAIEDQPRLAAATYKLENAFSDQFVRGQIDRAALAAPIHDVLEAMPEAARAKTQQHIDRVLSDGEALVAQLPADKRAELAAPPSPEKVGHVEQAWVGGWGWPGLAGWGGYGAFGFPGIATGYSTGYSSGYSSGYSTGYNTGYSTTYGYGLGYGGYGCGIGCSGWW